MRVTITNRIATCARRASQSRTEDLKFDAAHYRDVSRLALVDDGANARWIAWVSKPFTGARIEHFNDAELEQARAWIGAD